MQRLLGVIFIQKNFGFMIQNVMFFVDVSIKVYRIIDYLELLQGLYFFFVLVKLLIVLVRELIVLQLD